MTALLTMFPLPTPNPDRVARPKLNPFSLIQSELDEAEQVFAKTLAGYRSPFMALIEHLEHYRGKRLRPALLFLTAKACGGATAAHPTLAAAVEMIHTATLVHDDVLDNADTRRHVRTVNAGWGNQVSILLGDMLFTHAFHLTSQVDRRACEIIGEATNRVCAGELQQVCQRGNLNLSEADYFAILDGKTAALTECAVRLGALYAGADEALASRLATFGRNLGLAFQVADDLLDLFGEEAKAGKTLGTDLEQLKLTLPLIHCLANLPSAEADTLREQLLAREPNLRATVLAAFQKTDSLAYTRARAEDLVRDARTALEALPPSDARTMLETLAQWSIRRDK